MKPEKVALVTGSGKQRIGYHVARALARRGFALALHYFTSKQDADESVREIQSTGVQAIALQGDLTQEKAAHGLVDGTLDAFGRIDVLVNCAAEWKSKRFEEVTVDDVLRQFQINTQATFLCSQRAGLAMVRQPEGGCIVTLGDWAVSRPYLDYSAYHIAKGAIPTLTRVLAVELGVRNPAVRVNCILPGPVMMPADLPEAERQQSVAGTLVKREGSPDDVARAVLYLVESPFVTGTCLAVDGGRGIFAPDSIPGN